MKKTITVLLSVILIFNLISVRSFAADTDLSDLADLTPQKTGFVEMFNSNDDSILGSIKGTIFSNSLIFRIVLVGVVMFPEAMNAVMNIFIEEVHHIEFFTIYDTVMGNFEIFNIDYLHIPTKAESTESIVNLIKYTVIKNYYFIRNISIACSLFILIYIGIRMAISTVASEKAKYNKMLYSWVASLVLVFLMHFLIILISVVLSKALGFINNLAGEFDGRALEVNLYTKAIKDLLQAKVIHAFGSAVTVLILVYYQLKFFIFYIGRTLEVNFLILVSPLVSVTYSIDKAGDNKAQAFQAFLGELLKKSLIQVIHAVLYLIFIVSAGVIAEKQPILAVLFFAALSRTEKIVVRIFAVKEDGFQKVKVPIIDKLMHG